MNPDRYGLKPRHIDATRAILLPLADRLTRVAVFGSRATGTFRLHSDLDLVLHGDLAPRDVERLRTQFAESSLPFSVDVVAYQTLAASPLRQEIDRFQETLFTPEDFREPM